MSATSIARSAVPASFDRDSLREVVAVALNLEGQANFIQEDTNLFDLGIDSMAVMNLILAIEERFGVVLPEESLDAALFERFSTLADVVAAQAA